MNRRSEMVASYQRSCASNRPPFERRVGKHIGLALRCRPSGFEVMFDVVSCGVHVPTTWLWNANDKSSAVEQHWSCRPSSLSRMQSDTFALVSHQSDTSRDGARSLRGSASTMGPKTGDLSKTSLFPEMPQERRLGLPVQRKRR